MFMRVICILCMFMNYQAFCSLCSMPAALRNPQKNTVLDVQSMSYLRNHRFLYFLVFAPCAACLRRFETLKNVSPGCCGACHN